MQADHPEIILASASAARAAILGNAGLRFHQRPAALDESTEQLSQAERRPAAVASHLARRKAELVARMEPHAAVIGADQVLALGDRILHKPRDLEEARKQLKSLRGRPHQLYSAAILLHEGKARPFLDQATLTMRDFSDSFLEWYLETASETVLTSVGAYHFEGIGIHLFSRIEGDYFSILGLPIMPILDELRRLGVLLA